MNCALPTAKKKIPCRAWRSSKKRKHETDPDCGLFVEGEHESCFAYSAQTACDKHGFVLAFEVGAGNLHDGQTFHELYKKMELSKTQIIAVDADYRASLPSLH